ncbi:hypothetical protein [Flavobacterium sp. GCM10023249]|uniref:hypothetical protein n=1 Tax=unclassified Flavobacterium TaxID=196869 RepID=UPI003607F551
MKPFVYLLFFSFSFISFAQKKYEVTDGDLQYIHPSKGIILKKNNAYFQLQIDVDYTLQQLKLKSVLHPITQEDAIQFAQKKESISYNEIDGNFNYDALRKKQFIYSEEDTTESNYTLYKFCLFNPNYFAIFSEEHDTEKKQIHTRCEEFLPYLLLHFGKKKIIYTYAHEKLYLIPAKNKINLFGLHSDYVPQLKAEKIALTNLEIYNFSNHAFYELQEEYFKIDTLSDKKVLLKNKDNAILISKKYDSITLGKIIIGYSQKSIDFYNLALQKLNSTPVKSGKINLGSIQLIENNHLKLIDWTGKELKKAKNYTFTHLYEATSRNYYYELSFTKSKKNHQLTIKNLPFFSSENEATVTDTIPLINTSDIQAMYINTKALDTLVTSKKYRPTSSASNSTENSNPIPFYDSIVTYLKKDGTYGMNYLNHFLNLDYKNEFFTNNELANYQNLQSIRYIPPFYQLKKNNLYMVYPLQNQFRYKTLGDFQGNFARFELPNGVKGWLDSSGKEYFDD